jgi:hypothetical protein
MVPLTQSDGPTNRKDIAAETPASDLTRVIGIYRSLFHTPAYCGRSMSWRGQNNPTFSAECDWWAAVACESSAVR